MFRAAILYHVRFICPCAFLRVLCVIQTWRHHIASRGTPSHQDCLPGVYTGNARAASIYSQVLLLFAYIVCLLVSGGVCANVCINNIMINRNASCYVSIIYDEKWLLRVFFSICLRAWCPLYIEILRFKRVLFLQIYNCTAFMFKQFCVRTQLHISAIYI